MTSDQLRSFGLRPESAEPYDDGKAKGCGWRSTTPGEVGGVQVSTSTTLPALDGIYLTRSTGLHFEEIQVAGHPAVISDYLEDDCTIYTAVADHQGIATDANSALPTRAERCAESRRMTETILSNLPPLR